MASKTKTASFHDLIRTLLLVLLLRFWLQKSTQQVSVPWQDICSLFFCLAQGYKIRKRNFLGYNKNFICSFTSFMASKTKTKSFYGLIRPLFLVLVYGFNFQQGKRDVDKTWRDLCSFCFDYSYDIYNYKNSTDKIAGKYPGWKLET